MGAGCSRSGTKPVSPRSPKERQGSPSSAPGTPRSGGSSARGGVGKGGTNAWLQGVAFRTKGGQEPGYSKINQDAYLVEKQLGQHASLALLGVFDGHGPNGQSVAAFLRDALPGALMQQAGIDLAPGTALRKAFLEVDAKLVTGESRIDCEFSGCTAVTAVVQNRRVVHCGWAGDARAVIARVYPNGVQAVCLTQDHLPEDAAERARIVEAKGRVESMTDEKGNKIGPPRVWLKNQWVPGLPVSRALGNTLSKQIGVTAEISLTTHELQGEDRFLVLATPGVWRFVTPDEAVALVASCATADEACEKLVEHAHDRWLGIEAGVADDITAVIALL